MKLFIFKLNIYFLLFFLAVLTGCSRIGPNEDKNISWQDEVLLAEECGLDGLKCCENTNPSCRYGQKCCSDPQDQKNNFCSDDCSCGKENKFCCGTDPKCDPGMACTNSRCVKCGQEGAPCCLSDKCEGELICSGQKCFKCGVTGNPCCPDEPLCADQKKDNSQRSECQNGFCQLCGSNSNIACINDPKCNKNHLLNNSTCYLCGDFNKPCCDKNSVAGYECNPEAELECKLGFCAKK